MGREQRQDWECGGEELEEEWKTRRMEPAESSAWSEASICDPDDLIYITGEPPTSAIKTGQPLIFPMGKGRRPKPLPPCEGPKLEPFTDGDVHVKFIRLLGDNAIHSNVFEVTIDGRQYALKLFKTSNSSYFPDKEKWPPGKYPGDLAMAHHCGPFYRECRAYGRINELRLSHRYWRAYGYVRLPPYLRDTLCDITGLPDHYWQVRPPQLDGRMKGSVTRPGELAWPIYGIVKEMAPFPCNAIDPKIRSIRTMLADLRLLHKAGILNRDLASRNYLAGRMFDFSLSDTLPHHWYERPTSEGSPSGWDLFKDLAGGERFHLRKVIIRSGVKTTAVQDQPDGCVSSRTRGRRAGRPKGLWPLMSPLFELGVKEPHPPRSRSLLT